MGELGRRLDSAHADLKEDIRSLKTDLTRDVERIQSELGSMHASNKTRDREIHNLQGKMTVMLAGLPVGSVIVGFVLYSLGGAL